MTAILPDMVIKVSENLRDQHKIRKIRLREELETVNSKTNNAFINETLNYNDSDNSRERMKQFEYEEPTPVRLFILPSSASNSTNSSFKQNSNRNNLGNTKVTNTDISRF